MKTKYCVCSLLPTWRVRILRASCQLFCGRHRIAHALFLFSLSLSYTHTHTHTHTRTHTHTNTHSLMWFLFLSWSLASKTCLLTWFVLRIKLREFSTGPKKCVTVVLAHHTLPSQSLLLVTISEYLWVSPHVLSSHLLLLSSTLFSLLLLPASPPFLDTLVIVTRHACEGARVWALVAGCGCEELSCRKQSNHKPTNWANNAYTIQKYILDKETWRLTGAKYRVRESFDYWVTSILQRGKQTY